MIDRRILWAALSAVGNSVNEASFRRDIMLRLGTYARGRELEVSEAAGTLWQAAQDGRLLKARERARLDVEGVR